MYKAIKEWYQAKELSMLNKSLARMELDFALSSVDPIHIVHRYDNIQHIDEAGWEFRDDLPALISFCDQIGCSVDEVLTTYDHPEDDPFLMWKWLQASKIARDNVKHKELNDLNFVLYGKEEFYRR